MKQIIYISCHQIGTFADTLATEMTAVLKPPAAALWRGTLVAISVQEAFKWRLSTPDGNGGSNQARELGCDPGVSLGKVRTRTLIWEELYHPYLKDVNGTFEFVPWVRTICTCTIQKASKFIIYHIWPIPDGDHDHGHEPKEYFCFNAWLLFSKLGQMLCVKLFSQDTWTAQTHWQGWWKPDEKTSGTTRDWMNKGREKIEFSQERHAKTIQ